MFERFHPENSVVVVVDIQAKMMPVILDGDRVIARSRFLLRAAQILGVPILATEQNPSRLGATEPSLADWIGEPHAKMSFSAADFVPTNIQNVVLVGVETHICVAQTVLDLRGRGQSMAVVSDAVGARTEDRHAAGLQAITAAGARLIHSEALVYEWMASAEHPRFRDILGLVKELDS
jgi:nicotinamidase-related amidase